MVEEEVHWSVCVDNNEERSDTMSVWLRTTRGQLHALKEARIPGLQMRRAEDNCAHLKKRGSQVYRGTGFRCEAEGRGQLRALKEARIPGLRRHRV